MPKKNHPLLFVLLATILVLSWAAGFVGIRYATEGATVFQVLFWRSFVSGIGLVPVALMRGPKITLRAMAEQGLFALLGMVFYLGGFALAIGWRVPTGLVALMADLVPLAIAALSAPMLGQPLTGRQWVGTAIGMAGVLLVSADTLTVGTAPAFAYLLPILGMISFAFSILLQERRRAQELTIPQRLCLQCLAAAAMFAPCAAVTGGIMPPLTADIVFGIGWLVLLATYCSWTTYYLCLRLFPPAQVSAVIYLSPPVTMIWAWVMFDEPLTIAMAIGLIVTLAGVALVASAPKGRRAA